MEQFTNALQKFGIGRLFMILGVGAGVAAALVALTMTLGREPQALLYSNLDLKEASSVTQALDQAGVKYTVKGDGSTIMVARDQVASTRLLVSGKGLVTQGSVGYEIFDNTNALGQTDFVQKLNQQRALEGELGRTIREWDGVQSVRVHLALPKRQLFEEEAEAPSATVAIGLGGRDPSAEMVRAVQNLVSGAVLGMKVDRVTVVDQHGKTLSSGSDGSLAGKMAEDRKAEVEGRIGKTVKELVEGIVGPGRAQVKVTAQVDLNRITTQEERFDPDGQVVRSESTSAENSQEQRENANGGVTAAANIPGGQNPQGFQPLGTTSGANESVTNYEISKSVRTEVTEPGTIKKLSVAVAVDGATAVGADGKPGAYTPRSAQEMQQIEQLVRAAVGFDQERGDTVTVVNVRFPREAVDGEGVTAASPLMGFDKNDIMRFAELGIAAIVAILIMLFVVRPLLKNAGGGAAGGQQMIAMAGPDGTTQLVTLSAGATSAGGDMMAALPGPDTEQRINIAKIEGQVKASSIKQVSEFAEKHPEESVAILRSWLHESA
ncbi:MAG: flagellar M-ring protein FliF [Caulobacterales bacterium 68-7]|nr:flagellar M-ring protein FliF [Caulobacterales bacterium]OJU12959.1 MAG: flagellar M-ring protein FliF [Caulobacterales bacterium 68-7]